MTVPPTRPSRLSTQPRSANSDSLARSIGYVRAFNAWSMVLAGIVLAILGPIVLSSIANTAAKQDIKPSGIAQPFLAHPLLIVLVAAPAVIFGLWAARLRRPAQSFSGVRWLALTLATLSALAGVGIMLAALLALLGPLYEMPKL